MTIYFLKYSNGSRLNAGSKARNDLDIIFESLHFKPINLITKDSSINYNKLGNLLFQWQYLKNALKISRIVKSGDIVFIQHPIQGVLEFSFILKILKNKNVKFISIVHDLEIFRKWDIDYNKHRAYLSDIKILENNDAIILHNEKMINVYSKIAHIKSDKLINLQIFDYLQPNKIDNFINNKSSNEVIIAGNLRKEKAGYIYKLQNIPYNFNLYGAGYSETKKYPNINYEGSFFADELVNVMEGKFGLVWDGPSINTCEGNTGEYLKVNNPHKTSLYLSSGIPVIIWKKAALAEFIVKNNIGVAIDSLEEIPVVMDRISDEQYSKMKANCQNIAQKLCSGYFTKKAINDALELLSIEGE